MFDTHRSTSSSTPARKHDTRSGSLAATFEVRARSNVAPSSSWSFASWARSEGGNFLPTNLVSEASPDSCFRGPS